MSSSEDELIEECEICGGPVDANEPGHYKSADERFRHAICHATDGAPADYVLNIAEDHPTKASVNRQFNCGHVAYGPPTELPHECPACQGRGRSV